ncbi:MAG: DUF2520 domain-containing protein [Bacteroidetes bacterium]|nr:MAG: DUF2520 domain-containing protein [Bacteroidota bacterium]
MAQFNISFAGAGRVGGALCRELYSAGHNIGLIVSESDGNGKLLADYCKASWSKDLIFPESTEVLIVAVPDHKLKNVLGKISCNPGTLVVHTAGSFGTDVFPDQIERRGILYPLQTFSGKRKVVFKDLPFFIESSDKQSLSVLEKLTESVGGKVYFADSECRRMLHLAAVFACNFTNHMLTIGKELTLKTGFPFDVLQPLIQETISKALDLGPENSQTGPAVRNDQNTIEKHLELLSFSPELRRIYIEMTRSVIEYYQKH